MQAEPTKHTRDVAEKTLEQKEAPEEVVTLPYSRRETILTMLGVLIVVFLSMMDQTIVGTAMPRIIADLQGFEQIAWVTTAYLLTSTVPIPIYGKLSDLFGRKPVMLFGIVIFLAGSALSGAAQSMGQLIAFRAFQGLGAGALQPIAIAIIGDLFPPRERGKWQGISGSIYALAAILGPLAGGWISDHTTWRWVFYINLPIGIAAMLVLIFLMPPLRSNNRQVAIDYIGAMLLILGTVPLLLGLSLAGTQYDWQSPQMLGLFAASLVALTLLVLYTSRLERQGREPIFEPGLFKRSPRIFGVSVLVMVIFSLSLYGTSLAIPLFAQDVIGTTATYSGLILMPFSLTAIGGSMLSGMLLVFTGKYKFVAIGGIVIGIVGTLLLTRLDVHSGGAELLAGMLVLGLGVGTGLAVYTTAVQNALPDKLGLVSSTLVFFRQLGGTIGLAAMGSLLTASYVPAFHNALPAGLRQALPPRLLATFDNPLILLSPDAMSQIQAGFARYGAQGLGALNTVLQAVKVGLAESIHDIFLLNLGILIVGFVVVLFLKEIPLRKRASKV